MKYLKDYKKECVLSPLFKLLEATFELFVPLVMAAVIDKGIGHADKPYIVKVFKSANRFDVPEFGFEDNFSR